MELWCKDFSVKYWKPPDACLSKVSGDDDGCCLEQKQVQAATPGGVCSQVSTEHMVPDSM